MAFSWFSILFVSMHFRTNIKYREKFEMWCWGRMEKISWTDRANNEEVLRRIRDERYIIHTIKRRKANWIVHILCGNCLLKHFTEGTIEGRTEGLRRRRKQLHGDLHEMTACCKLREEALDRTMWRTCFWKRDTTEGTAPPPSDGSKRDRKEKVIHKIFNQVLIS